MKKYKYTKNGKVSFINVSDEKLEGFLAMYPDATLAEDSNNENDFQKGGASGVDALPGKKTTPMGTVLDGENGSLELEDTKKRDSLVFNITETENQINNYIEKGGEVNESDAAVLQGYKDELSALDKSEADNKFIENIRPEVLDIFKKNQKDLKITEIGTIDYDNLLLILETSLLMILLTQTKL